MPITRRARGYLPRTRHARRARGYLPRPDPAMRGILGRAGYSTVRGLRSAARHRALAKAIRARGSSPMGIMRRLILIHNFSRRSNPRSAKQLRADAHWISKRFLRR